MPIMAAYRRFRSDIDEPSRAQLILSLLVTILSTIVQGFVGMTAWNWFIPVVFSGAPHLNIVTAIGVSIVLSAFSSPSEDNRSLGKLLFDALAWNIVLLVLAFVVHLFV